MAGGRQNLSKFRRCLAQVLRGTDAIILTVISEKMDFMSTTRRTGRSSQEGERRRKDMQLKRISKTRIPIANSWTTSPAKPTTKSTK